MALHAVTDWFTNWLMAWMSHCKEMTTTHHISCKSKTGVSKWEIDCMMHLEYELHTQPQLSSSSLWLSGKELNQKNTQL